MTAPLANYDSSTPGVPYVRVHKLVIEYPADDSPGNPIVLVQIYQSEAVVLADGTRRTLRADLPTLTATVDTPQEWTDPIPLVHPTTGEALTGTTTMQQVMMGLLACIRAEQTR